MNYKWHYDRLIETRKERVPEDGKYYERHHVLPVSMGGTNNAENLVKLTAREHFLAHWLLWRIHRKSVFAKHTSHAFTMMRKSSRNHERKILSAREYAELREAYSMPKTEEEKVASGRGVHIYWSRMSAEEKSIEMKRRRLLQKKNKILRGEYNHQCLECKNVFYATKKH